MPIVNAYHKGDSARQRASYLEDTHRFHLVVGDTTSEQTEQMTGQEAKRLNLVLRQAFVTDCMEHAEPVGRLSYWKCEKKGRGRK